LLKKTQIIIFLDFAFLSELHGMEKVKQMKCEQLCEWLKTQLDEDEWDMVQTFIRQHLTKGRDFLDFSLEDWVKVVGLPAGLGNSLFRISQQILSDDEDKKRVMEQQMSGRPFKMPRINEISGSLYVDPNDEELQRYRAIAFNRSKGAASFEIVGKFKCF
jgi:hypothetical protein